MSIETAEQFEVTRHERAKLALALELGAPVGTPEWVARASREALASQIYLLDLQVAQWLARREPR